MKGLGDVLKEASGKDVQYATPSEQIVQLPISQISSDKNQPRKNFKEKELDELADSLEANGLISPILVRELEDNKYIIIAGERRWRAAKKLKWAYIGVIIKNLSTKEAQAIALVENIQREELNPIEEAIGLKNLITNFCLSHEELGKHVGRSRAAISNSLRLLKLSKVVQEALISEEVEVGHCKLLMTLDDEKQSAYLAKILKNRLSVRELELSLKTIKNKTTFSKTHQEVGGELQEAKELKQILKEILNIEPTIVCKNNNHLKLNIEFGSVSQIKNLLHYLKFSG